MAKYRAHPLSITGMPPGIPNIVGNEGAERFSFYGMLAILVIYMTKHLLDSSGQPAVMGEAEAKSWYHMFGFALYGLSFLGAIVSDLLLGKYRTIVSLSIVYCLGHLALALDDTRTGLILGLGLIALGSGGIKPCVSAHVGDQFGSANTGLREVALTWFYWSINLGAVISMLLTPWLLEHHGPRWAFGVPGIAMALATLFFWMGRHKFAHIPPGGRAYRNEVLSRVGLIAMARLSCILAFVVIFWSLYAQTGSAWVLQAEKMNLTFLGITWLPSQIQAINPILILILSPLFAYRIYPWLSRYVRLTPLVKFEMGFLLCALSFVLTAWVEHLITSGQTPSIGWQVLAYVIITTAEVMVSITCLDFVYSQSPPRMKSTMMALFLVSISLGNLLTAAVNDFIQNPDGTTKLVGADYYLFFAVMMAVTALLFVPVMRRYKIKEYTPEGPPRSSLAVAPALS